jgi:hypothetical protein
MERTSAGGSGPLGQLYLPYIDENYALVAQTPNWRILRSNGAGRGALDSATDTASPVSR